MNLVEMVSFHITLRHLEHCEDKSKRTFEKLFPVMFPDIMKALEIVQNQKAGTLKVSHIL
jgi:hypothetical protein